MDLILSIAKIAAVLCLVFINGFFVAAEFAIVKVRGTQIEPLLKAGASGAKSAKDAITNLDAYLSATQLGITLASLLLGWFGEPFVADLLVPVCAAAGIVQPAVVGTVSFIIAFAIIIFLTVVLGELAPKWLAIQRAQKIVLAVAGPLQVFLRFFRPVIWLLNRSATAVLGLLGVPAPRSSDIAHSEEELRLLLGKEKAFSSTGRSILLNVIELQNRTVREVMVPRTSILYLSVGKSLEENIAIAQENQFTRYPLCEKDLDNVIGMIHLKDLFKLKGDRGSGARLLEIKREMLFVPETTALERILNTFLARRILMAIAVDEYGGTAGLVTLENVLEELVGEIRDEFDVEPTLVQKLSDNEYLVDGTMPLHDFARKFEIVPESKDVVTVGGYAIRLLGRVPEKGATIRLGSWTGTIDATERRKVKTLRIKRVPEPVGKSEG